MLILNDLENVDCCQFSNFIDHSRSLHKIDIIHVLHLGILYQVMIEYRAISIQSLENSSSVAWTHRTRHYLPGHLSRPNQGMIP